MSAHTLPQVERLKGENTALKTEVDIMRQTVAILTAQVGDLQQRLSVIEARREQPIAQGKRRGGKAAVDSRY